MFIEGIELVFGAAVGLLLLYVLLANWHYIAVGIVAAIAIALLWAIVHYDQWWALIPVGMVALLGVGEWVQRRQIDRQVTADLSAVLGQKPADPAASSGQRPV